MTLTIKFCLIIFSFLLVSPAFGQTIPNTAKTVKKDTTVTTTVKRAKSKDEIAYDKQYQINILKSRIDGNYIPKDLFDSFVQLKRLMGTKVVADFKALPEARAGKKIRFIMWIVESWYFRQGSRLSHNLRSTGITYPEHLAHFVVISFHRHLNGVDLDVKGQVAFYKEKEKEKAGKGRTVTDQGKRKRED